MELHVPTAQAVSGFASVVGYLTDGLDAVVVAHQVSQVHEGHMRLDIAGNARDLAEVAKRAARIGGKVDG